MTTQSRQKALLETIRQGLFLSSIQNTHSTLGDRSQYVGLSEISKYAECPRAAIAAKLGAPVAHMTKLLATQRGHWFEEGIKSALAAASLKHFHQLEININRRSGTIKAHLDFTLVWEQPAKAIRILEVKSTERIPDAPWNSHGLQAQGQVDLLRHYWNKPVFSLRDGTGKILYESLSFPQLCKERFGLELTTRPSSVSAESWILYLSMKEAKAFGPYVYSPESLEALLGKAQSFQQNMSAVLENIACLDELPYPQGFYPLCGHCEYNAGCPKFRQGSYQPQWEPAIRKLDVLKKRQHEIAGEIREIEDALKQAHGLSETKDWIDTGEHRFRMSMVSGRKSLNQDALKMELADIFHGMGSEIDINGLFASCMKQGASFPRLTITAVN